MSGRPALVACDLDGTLLDGDGAPLAGVSEALAGLTSAGVEVVICTGRSAGSTRTAAARLGLEHGVAIAYHGAVFVDLAGGRWVRRFDLPRQAVGPLVAALHEAGATLTAYVDDERWVQGEPGGAGDSGSAGVPAAADRGSADDSGRAPAGPGAAGVPGSAPAAPRARGDLAVALEGVPVTRLIIEAGAAPGYAPLATVVERLAARWPELVVSPAPGGRLEVHRTGADKRTALATLCEGLRLPAAAVVACGDGAADAGMLAWAGLGVAIAGGSDAARAAANVVVAPGELGAFLAGLAAPPAGRPSGDATVRR